MQYLINRLSEISTYAGLAAILSGLGLFGLSVENWQTILAAVAALAGVAGIFIKEKGAADATTSTDTK